jgi:putative flippase GtrA
VKGRSVGISRDLAGGKASVSRLSIRESRPQARLLMQFVCFAGVGVAGTCVHYAVLIVLVEVLGVSAVPGSAAGFVVGALVNYLLNHRFTFRSHQPHCEVAPKFYAVAMTGFVLNTTIMTIATHSFTVPYLLAQAAATAMVLIWNFSANRWWTFKEKRDAAH